MFVFLRHFIYLFVYYYVLDRLQFVLKKLYNIGVLLKISGTFKLIREILTLQLVPRQTAFLLRPFDYHFC